MKKKFIAIMSIAFLCKGACAAPNLASFASQKNNLLSIMKKIKTAAENHNQEMKKQYEEHKGPSAQAIVDAHISDGHFLPLYTDLFESSESSELLSNFVDQRTIGEIFQITRENAISKLDEIYKGFFKKEKFLNFADKNLLAPRKLEVRKIGEYQPYNLRDFFNELNQHDISRKTLGTLRNELKGNTDYDKNWEQILAEFKIDATKYEGPAPQTYISFVKLMYFFRGFLTHNHLLIAQNAKKFDRIFDFSSFTEMMNERRDQDNWLCGPGYANRLLLDLIVFLRQKISLAFAENLSMAEKKELMTEDEYQAMAAASSNALFAAGLLENESFEHSRLQLQEMVAVEGLLTGTNDEKIKTVEQWVRKKDPKSAFFQIYQKHLAKEKKVLPVDAFRSSVQDINKVLVEKAALLDIQKTYKDFDTSVIENILKEFNQSLENKKQEIYFNPQNRSSILKSICNQVCTKYKVKSLTDWDEFAVSLKSLETFFVARNKPAAEKTVLENNEERFNKKDLAKDFSETIKQTIKRIDGEQLNKANKALEKDFSETIKQTIKRIDEEKLKKANKALEKDFSEIINQTIKRMAEEKLNKVKKFNKFIRRTPTSKK